MTHSSRELQQTASDDNGLYIHPTFKKAHAYMQYALIQGEGIVLVTGEPGIGKTALVSQVIAEHDKHSLECHSLECARFDGDDLLGQLARLCGLETDNPTTSGLISIINKHLKDVRQRGKRSVLLLDEAHLLTDDALETIRLLSNLQVDGTPMLQVFLVGQPLLRERMLTPELTQLHQRIIATCNIDPLNAEDTQGYVMRQLTAVNWNPSAGISDRVFRAIHSASLGIPRWINLICNRLMIHAIATDRLQIELDDICEVLSDLMSEDLLPEQVRQANRRSAKPQPALQVAA
jgi:type II secretory pathway predicted ATPase ExeA